MSNNGVQVLPRQSVGSLDDAPAGYLEIIADLETGRLATIDENGDIVAYGALPKNYLHGLRLSTNDSNPAYQIDINEGVCRSDDNLADMEVATPITVDLTASGANGLDTGSEAANTWYYVFVIKNLTTGVVAGLLSTSLTSPVLPSGYTKKRRVGVIRNNASSNILNFIVCGQGVTKKYIYRQILDGTVLYAGSDTDWTDVDCSAVVPPTCRMVELVVYAVDTGNSFLVGVRENGQTGTLQSGLAGYEEGQGAISCSLDASQVLEYTVTAATTDASLYIHGFNDLL